MQAGALDIPAGGSARMNISHGLNGLGRNQGNFIAPQSVQSVAKNLCSTQEA